MGARAIIVTASFFFFIPAGLLALISPHMGGGEPQYGLFVLTFPFMGTCPFPVNGNMNNLSDMYYWPVLAGVGTAIFGVAGFVTENQKWAAIYAAILVLCWILVAVRLFAFNR